MKEGFNLIKVRKHNYIIIRKTNSSEESEKMSVKHFYYKSAPATFAACVKFRVSNRFWRSHRILFASSAMIAFYIEVFGHAKLLLIRYSSLTQNGINCLNIFSWVHIHDKWIPNIRHCYTYIDENYNETRDIWDIACGSRLRTCTSPPTVE